MSYPARAEGLVNMRNVKTACNCKDQCFAGICKNTEKGSGYFRRLLVTHSLAINMRHHWWFPSDNEINWENYQLYWTNNWIMMNARAQLQRYSYCHWSSRNKISVLCAIGLISRVFANSPGDQGSNPGRVIPKTQKMVLDSAFLYTQHYKVWIKRKMEQSRKRTSTLPYPLVL